MKVRSRAQDFLKELLIKYSLKVQDYKIDGKAFLLWKRMIKVSNQKDRKIFEANYFDYMEESKYIRS